MMDTDYREALDAYYASFITINNLYSSWAKEKGLSYHALFILHSIYHSANGCSAKEICEKWLIPKQTVNSVLRIFDQHGYVCYQVQTQDRRNKMITLTEQGIEYAKPILDGLYRLETAALETMGAELVSQLIECNQRYQEKFAEAVADNVN